jgi:hypothetical protein
MRPGDILHHEIKIEAGLVVFGWEEEGPLKGYLDKVITCL